MSKKVLNKRSNQVVNGKAKLPTTSELDYGEIAINYHDGVESIYIKNDSGEVVTFATEENLNKTELKSDQEFSYRKTGVDWDTKAATIKSIKGNTLVWNNLYDKSKDYSTQTYYGVTATTNIDGSITFSGTCTQSESFALTAMDNDHKMIVGHKYYLRGATATTPRLRLSDQTTIYDEGSGAIWTCNLAVGVQLACNIQPNITYSGTIKVKIIDLTLMFGPGKEPSTVAEFDALFKEPSYTFTPGTLISNDAKGIETVGFNIWDEEWELGSWTTSGSKYTRIDAIRCKDLIPILPNTDYYYKSPTASGGIGYFDINKSFLGSEYYVLSPFNRVHRSPENAYFVVFYTLETSYNNNICINISDPNRNGQYEPYAKSYLPLNLSSLKVKSPNIWDEEWEVGGFVGGSLNSKNFISVLPSTTYYFKTPQNNNIFYYDANHNQISTGEALNTTFTTPANCAFIKFRISTDYGTTYNNDICINVSSSFNGQYEPHGIITIEGGLRSGSSYDGTTTVRDEIVRNKYIKRINKKTGSSFVLHNTSSANYKTWKTILDDGEPNGSSNQHQINSFGIVYTGLLNSDSVNYETIQYDGSGGYTYYISFNPNRDINDFVLYYALATPIEYELVEPLTSVYMVDKDGTERAVNPVHEDGSPSAPFNGDIQYGVSHGDIAVDTSKLSERVSHISDLSDSSLFVPGSGSQDSIQSKFGSCLSEGDYSFTVGRSAHTIGDYSFACGDSTYAYGDASHAEGRNTITSGLASHAEGYSTKAVGDASHAEGWSSNAIGLGSHTEGYNCISKGRYSHSEGNNASSIGNYSHSEGVNNFVVGNGSHAEGVKRVTCGDYSHIEGFNKENNLFKADCTIGSSQTQSFEVWKNNIFSGTTFGPITTYTIPDGGAMLRVTAYTINCHIAFSIDDSGVVTYYTIPVASQYQPVNISYSHIPGGGLSCNGLPLDRPSSSSTLYISAKRVTLALNPSRYTGQTDTCYSQYIDDTIVDPLTLIGEALGEACHVEGYGTMAYNQGEHAEGKYNVSHTGSSYSAKTISSIGFGYNVNAKTNAFEVMQNGDVYMYGVNGYNGQSVTGNTVQALITSLTNRIAALESQLQGLETLLSQI